MRFRCAQRPGEAGRAARRGRASPCRYGVCEVFACRDSMLGMEEESIRCQFVALSPSRKAPICSFRNFASSLEAPAPAGCPHSEGIGTSEQCGMNAASYRASLNGKYRSVSEGTYKTCALIERKAA